MASKRRFCPAETLFGLTSASSSSSRGVRPDWCVHRVSIDQQSSHPPITPSHPQPLGFSHSQISGPMTVACVLPGCPCLRHNTAHSRRRHVYQKRFGQRVCMMQISSMTQTVRQGQCEIKHPRFCGGERPPDLHGPEMTGSEGCRVDAMVVQAVPVSTGKTVQFSLTKIFSPTARASNVLLHLPSKIRAVALIQKYQPAYRAPWPYI